MKKEKKRFFNPKTIEKNSWVNWGLMVLRLVIGMIFIEPFWMLFKPKWFRDDIPAKDKRHYAIILHDVHGFDYLRVQREWKISGAMSEHYVMIEKEPLGISYINSKDMPSIANTVAARIRQFGEKKPRRTLHIIGIGLGGVLATHVEGKLRDCRHFSAIDVTTIAAPLHGTVWGRISPGMLQKQMGKEMAKIYDPDYKDRLHPGVANLPKNVTYHHVYSAADFSIAPAECSMLYENDILRLDSTPNRYVATDPKTLEFLSRKLYK